MIDVISKMYQISVIYLGDLDLDLLKESLEKRLSSLPEYLRILDKVFEIHEDNWSGRVLDIIINLECPKEYDNILCDVGVFLRSCMIDILRNSEIIILNLR